MKNAWQKIVAKAWMDEDFKARLLADPQAVFTEEGLDLPEGTIPVVVEQKPGQAVFVLSAEANDSAVTEVEERIAAMRPH